MAFDIHKNLAYSTIASITSQDGSTLIMVLQTGDGSKFAVGQQIIIWAPQVQALQSNAMICRITGISTDTLTCDVTAASREGTSTRVALQNDQVANSETVKVFTDIETPLLAFADFVQSGATVSVSNSLTQTLAAGVAWINNQKITIATDGGHLYTASKDTYVDVDSTNTVSYNEVANNAAAPALSANSIRLGKIISNGTRVTFAIQDSSFDSLGNKIYPISPLARTNYQNINLSAGMLLNGKIAVSVASNNLTVAVKTMAGLDPDSTHPVYCRIGNTVRAITAALSVTKNAGTNWFNAGSVELATHEIDYFVYLGYNATDGVVLGFARVPFGQLYSDFSVTTTDNYYCAISTITNAAAGDDYEVIGRFAATLSAGAGYTWSVPTFTSANLIQKQILKTRKLTYTVTPSGTGGSAGTVASSFTAMYWIDYNICRVLIYGNITNVGSWSGTMQLSTPFIIGSAVGDTLSAFGGWYANAAVTPRAIFHSIDGSGHFIYVKAVGSAFLAWSDVVTTDYINAEPFYPI